MKAMSDGQAINMPPGMMVPGGAGALPRGAPTPSAPDPIGQLEKLNELRKSGALTQAELTPRRRRSSGRRRVVRGWRESRSTFRSMSVVHRSFS